MVYIKKGYNPWNKGKHMWIDNQHPMLGKHHTEESNRKNAEWHKGKPAWNKGLTKETSEGVKKMSEHNAHYWLDKQFSEEHRKKLSNTTKNAWTNAEWKMKMSESRKGHIGYTKGKELSEEHKKKISIGNKGKHRSEETRMRMSLANKGERNPNYGKHHTEEWKRKIGEAQKGKIGPWRGKHLPEETRKKMRIARLHTIIPNRDTGIERKIQDELSSREIGFYKHYPVMGQPDIAFPDRKIAIFCDGDYWHGKREGVQEKDNRVNEKLRNDGWLVLRYWEHEINVNAEGVVDEIEDRLL